MAAVQDILLTLLLLLYRFEICPEAIVDDCNDSTHAMRDRLAYAERVTAAVSVFSPSGDKRAEERQKY